MLETLTARLARIVKHVRGEARLTEANIQEALREVRIALLEADVALPVVKQFIDAVRTKALGAEVAGSLTPGQAFVGTDAPVSTLTDTLLAGGFLAVAPWVVDDPFITDPRLTLEQRRERPALVEVREEGGDRVGRDRQGELAAFLVAKA